MDDNLLTFRQFMIYVLLDKFNRLDQKSLFELIKARCDCTDEDIRVVMAKTGMVFEYVFDMDEEIMEKLNATQ